MVIIGVVDLEHIDGLMKAVFVQFRLYRLLCTTWLKVQGYDLRVYPKNGVDLILI